MLIEVNERLARRLQEIAIREGRPIEDVLEDAVQKSIPAEAYEADEPEENWALKLVDMVEADDDPIWDELPPDLSERSREILETEFADYLAKRIEGTANS